MAELVSRVMLDAINKEVSHKGSFFRDKFFGVSQAISERLFEYDIKDFGGGVLPFAGYESEPTTSVVKGFQTKQGKFEIIKHSHILSPYELQNRLPGRTCYDSDNKIAELQNISVGELESQLIQTEEYISVQALTTGKVEVYRDLNNTNKITLADYWSTDTDKPQISVSTPWTDSTKAGTILAEIMSWRDKIIEKGGTAPRTLVVSANVGRILCGALINTPQAIINPANLDAGADYNSEAIQFLGMFAGLEIYSCGATVNGQKLLANGTAILGSNGVNKMMYGVTYIPTGEDNFTPFVGRRSMYSILNKRTMCVENIIQSAPLPLIRRKWDCVYISNIV